jgi:hypothetical protein
MEGGVRGGGERGDGREGGGGVEAGRKEGGGGHWRAPLTVFMSKFFLKPIVETLSLFFVNFFFLTLHAEYHL